MDVIDLDEQTVSLPAASRLNRTELSRFAPRHRVIGIAIVLVVAVAGLRVHALDAPATPDQPGTTARQPGATPDRSGQPVEQPPAPETVAAPAVVPVPKGPAARRTDGALLTRTASRLLLLGNTLTTYDVTSGVATRPFVADPGTAVIGAAGVTDGEVVVESLGEASGQAFALDGGHRGELGIATQVLPGVAVDTAWLTDQPESVGPTRVRLVDLAGDLLAGPYPIPADWRMEAAVPGGILLAVGNERAPYALHLWTPGSSSPGPLLASDVAVTAAGGGQVLTVSGTGVAAVDGRSTGLPGDALAYAVSADGSTLAALGATSIVVEPRLPGATRRVIALPAGAQPTALAFSPSGWLFASLGTRVVAVAPGASMLTALPAVFSDPPTDLVAAAAIGTPANPRTGH